MLLSQGLLLWRANPLSNRLGFWRWSFVSDEISSANPSSPTTQNFHDDVSSRTRSSSSDKTFRGESSATNEKSYSDRVFDPDFSARAAGNTLGPYFSRSEVVEGVWVLVNDKRARRGEVYRPVGRSGAIGASLCIHGVTIALSIWMWWGGFSFRITVS